MAVRRRFSAAFKGQVVEEVLAGAATMAQVCRRYELGQTVVRNWREQYAQGRLAHPEQVGQNQQQRILELERMVGHVTMENALRFPRYGCRRMTRQLQREGFAVNHKRVLRLMRESDLLVKCRRKWLSTTDSRHGFRGYSSL